MAIETSLISLSDLLRHPDDLDKISTLKSEYTRKKTSIDSQLRSGLKEQLETTSRGLSGIKSGQDHVQQIKEEMMKIDKLCAEAQNMIRDFPNINLVSQIHRNFSAVEEMRGNLEGFAERIERVDAMIREDEYSIQMDGQGNYVMDSDVRMPNLLATHYELTLLRNIRDDALEQMKRVDSEDAQNTLENYFGRLDDVIEKFDNNIGNIAFNILEIVRRQNEDDFVVRFAVIIEAEEKNDKRVKALQDALRDHKEMAARFQGMNDGAKQIRGYKESFIKAIEMTAQAQVKNSEFEFLEDPKKSLKKHFNWFFQDLNTVKLGLSKMTPKKWKIFKVYLEIYHRLMHDWVIAMVDDENTSQAILLILLAWPEAYYKLMAKLGVPQDDLLPHVMDNREAELVRGFRDRIVQYLDEWIGRIFESEKKDFASRTVDANNLDTDEYNYFRTKNMVDLWRMLREQTDVAASSERQDVTEGVIDTMIQRLRTRQQTWQKMLDDEVDSYLRANTEADDISTLQDWLIATANDQIACIDDNEDEGRLAYLSSFRQKFEPLVSPQYLEKVDTEITTLSNGYVDLSTHCLTQFARLVVGIDFKPVLAELFTPAWYASNSMERMVNTLVEYISDYKSVLHASLLDTFIEALSDELLIRYLSSVRNKSAKFKRQDPFQAKIYDEISLVLNFFQTSPVLSPDVGELLKGKWRVTSGFLDLLQSDKASIPDVFVTFKQSNWDLQLSWVEAVLKSRDDFDRALLTAVKAKAAEVDVPRGMETIMGQIK